MLEKTFFFFFLKSQSIIAHRIKLNLESNFKTSEREKPLYTEKKITCIHDEVARKKTILMRAKNHLNVRKDRQLPPNYLTGRKEKFMG